MIKATATAADGRTVLVLGLSHANLDKLRADGLNGYVRVKGEEVGLTVDVLITAGPTEADIAEALRQFVGPETKVHVTDRYKEAQERKQ